MHIFFRIAMMSVIFIFPTANAGTFQDCDACPVMVTVPAGSFRMGTAVADRLTDPRTGKPATNDSPQHAVTFEAPFALGKYEVTVAEFAAFVADTGHQATNRCMEFSKPESFSIGADYDWKRTGFEQTDIQPVVCISFHDAVAYTAWLKDLTGENYRLPSEAEWEYAARADSTTPYFWGTDPAQACEYANVRSDGAFTISKRQAAADAAEGFPCDDQVVHSADVGTYQPNEFGLYDMQGNAWEWMADCNHKDYDGAPTNGAAWLDADGCPFAVIRGGSYLNLVERSSTTVRAGRPKTGGATNMGFRVAKGGADDSTAGPGPADNPAALPISENLKTLGGRVFAENCAACHVDRATYKGVYGKSQASIERAIHDGGNNSMSMPAFGETLTDQEITGVAEYVREINGWDTP